MKIKEALRIINPYTQNGFFRITLSVRADLLEWTIQDNFVDTRSSHHINHTEASAQSDGLQGNYGAPVVRVTDTANRKSESFIRLKMFS